MHRRQYIAQNRVGFYEVMKWRNHANKFSAWQAAQLRDLMAFIICTPSRLEIHQKRREQLRQMLAGARLTFRMKVWLTIYSSRFVLRVRAAFTRLKGLFKKPATATA